MKAVTEFVCFDALLLFSLVDKNIVVSSSMARVERLEMTTFMFFAKSFC